MMQKLLPSYEDLKADKMTYARSFYIQYLNTDPFYGKRLVEPYSEHRLCGTESTGKTTDADGDG